MKHRTKNALLGAAGAVISAAAIREGVSLALDHGMVGEALDRQEPRAMLRMLERLKGYSISAADMAALQIMVDRLATREHEVIQIKSFDGTGLTGHLFRVENPRRVIVAMHGWRSGWARDFSLVADFLAENGCTVLYAEQRGQGESGGDYMGFGMIERHDCLEWAKWLGVNGFEKLPMYLIGISMGATTVLMTAGSEALPENVKGIIADCGFTSAKAVWRHISEKNLRIPYGRREKHVDHLCRKRIDLDSDAYCTLEAMEHCRVPILFIHGAADTFVPAEMTMQNYEACRAPKYLLIVEGANHGMSYVMARERYERAVLDFWEEQEDTAQE